MTRKANALYTIYLMILISLGYFATDIYLPSFPAIARYFEVDKGSVQATMSAYLFSFSFAPLIFGPLSDHIGRKKVILLGLIIGFFASVGCYTAYGIYSLIAFRFLQGMGLGACVIAARAMVPDLYRGTMLARQMSYISMSMPLILAFGPTLGGYLQQRYDWQSVFLFLIVYILIILVAVLASKESVVLFSDKSISSVFSSYKELLTNRSFVLFNISMALPGVGLFGFLTASSFLFQEVFGFTPQQYGMLAIYIGIVIGTTSYLNTQLLRYISLNTLLWVGPYLMVIAALLLLSFYSMGIVAAWAVFLPTLLFFACMPFTIGNCSAKAIHQISRHFGVATALLTTAQFLFGSLGSLAFSLIKERSIFSLGFCYLIIGILSFVNLFFASKYDHSYN